MNKKRIYRKVPPNSTVLLGSQRYNQMAVNHNATPEQLLQHVEPTAAQVPSRIQGRNRKVPAIGPHRAVEIKDPISVKPDPYKWQQVFDVEGLSDDSEWIGITTQGIPGPYDDNPNNLPTSGIGPVVISGVATVYATVNFASDKYLKPGPGSFNLESTDRPTSILLMHAPSYGTEVLCKAYLTGGTFSDLRYQELLFTQTGGEPGDSENNPSFTYTVTDVNGVVLDTDFDPTSNGGWQGRSLGEHKPGTIGWGYWDEEQTDLRVITIDEIPLAEPCDAVTPFRIINEDGAGTPPPAPVGLGDEVSWACPSLDDANNGTAKVSANVGGSALPDGDLMAGASWVADTGAGGVRAIKLERSSSQYVKFGNEVAYRITGALTVNIWVWVDPSLQTDTTGNPIMIGKYMWPSDRSYQLFFKNPARTLIGAVSGDGAAPVSADGGNAVNFGAWAMYTMTFSPSTFIRIYKNGSLDTENTVGVPASIYDGTAELQIGQDSEGNPNHFLDGLWDDARLFSRVIDADELAWLYNAGAGRGRLGGPP